MKTIYLIEQVNFDSEENYNPIHIEILGYADNELDAKNIVKTLDSKSPKHKGWNGEFYPQFKVRKIKKLELIIGVATLL